MYAYYENYGKQFTSKPYESFDSQNLIAEIESNTLIVNYKKDKLVQQSKKKVRDRGKIQYVKDKQGNFKLDLKGEKIVKIADGDTIRSPLFAQTYLGKIKDVERYNDGQPIRENGDWKYKLGKEEFIFVKRESIEKVKTSDKLIETIIDPTIRKLVSEQKKQNTIKDYQGNIIRHVRVKSNMGKEVKERVNYLSKHNYKNNFYSEAGSLPYAILLQKNINDKMLYEMLPLASFEIAKMKKEHGKFTIENYIKENHKEFIDWAKNLMKIGQKVIVLQNDIEFEKRKSIDFQQKRLYVITQFSEGSIWLRYHLNALSKDEVKNSINVIKDELCSKYEIELNISEVIEDITIEDNKARKTDYENKRFRFDTINNSYRLNRLLEIIGEEKTKEFKKKLDKYKAIPSTIVIEGETPLLKVSKENWNFLFENKDFEISLLGKIKWIDE
jgi:CRISPR-associated endonuclease Csn1